MLRSLTLATTLVSSPVSAEVDAFVEANLLSIFYHELGHALIDILRLPVFGQEEDAADVASVLLIDAFFEEESAVEIAYHAAYGFLSEAEERGDDIAWWDVHGPDLQRYYNLVCLFVGADIEEREDLAYELGLPEDRLLGCPDEFDIANESWGPVFDELDGPGETILYQGRIETFTEVIIADEVAALNRDFHLPQHLAVRVEDCGVANAFYDLDRVEITICSEFENWLREIAP